MTPTNITIVFDKPLESYTEADVKVTHSQGISATVERTYISDSNPTNLIITLKDSLMYDTVYTVSADLKFTLKEGGVASWKKTWGFTTEKDATFVDIVVDLIKDLFGGKASEVDDTEPNNKLIDVERNMSPEEKLIVNTCYIKQKDVEGVTDYRDHVTDDDNNNYDCSKSTDCCSLSICKDSYACIPSQTKEYYASICNELFQEDTAAARELRTLNANPPDYTPVIFNGSESEAQERDDYNKGYQQELQKAETEYERIHSIVTAQCPSRAEDGEEGYSPFLGPWKRIDGKTVYGNEISNQ
jgi:hypothetical protein